MWKKTCEKNTIHVDKFWKMTGPIPSVYSISLLTLDKTQGQAHNLIDLPKNAVNLPIFELEKYF